MTREEDFEEQGRITLNDYIRGLDDYDFGEASMVSMFIFGAHYADQHPRKGLWDSKKVCAWIGNHLLTSCQGYILDDLRKAMEE